MAGFAELFETNPTALLVLVEGVKKAEKEVGAKALRNAVPAGEHEASLTLTLDAALKKGEDGFKASTCSIPWLTVVGLLLKQCGFQRELIIPALEKIIPEAMEMDAAGKKVLEAELGIEEFVKRFKKEVVATLPQTAKVGTVTVQGVEMEISANA
jgi:hypothetical protein